MSGSKETKPRRTYCYQLRLYVLTASNKLRQSFRRIHPPNKRMNNNDSRSLSAEGDAPASPAGNHRPLDDFLDAANAPFKWRYWMIFISLGVANSSDAAEILCLSYILSDKGFSEGILEHMAWRGGLLAATVFCGMLIGGLVVGCLGDSWGRRPMLVTGLTVNSVSGLLSALATGVYTLSMCRFVSGLGIGATVPPLFALCSELAPAADRGFWVTVAASFWMVGSMYVAVVAWMILGSSQRQDSEEEEASQWRLFAAACAAPSLLGCMMVYHNVPESPRFLLLQGRYREALKVIKRLACTLEYTGPLATVGELEHYYPPPSYTQSMTEDSAGDGLAIGYSTLRSNRLVKSPFRDFVDSTSQLYTPHIRSTTLPLQMVWFSLSFGSYGLLTWINTLFFEVHLENVYFNALLFSASNLPGNLISAFFMDRMGRAKLLTASVLAAALSLVAFAYVAAERAKGTTSLSTSWIVLSACSFQCFTISAWNAIDVLTSELFPTTVRSTGMGVCAATGRVGAMLAQFINGALVANPVALLLVAASTLLLGSVTPALLPPDQTGRPMEDFALVDDNHMYGKAKERESSSPGVYESIRPSNV